LHLKNSGKQQEKGHEDDLWSANNLDGKETSIIQKIPNSNCAGSGVRKPKREGVVEKDSLKSAKLTGGRWREKKFEKRAMKEKESKPSDRWGI